MADFIEWCAWRDGSCSARATNKVIDQLDDNFDNIGCDDNSDETGQSLEEVFSEFEYRQNACNGAYPFKIVRSGSVLHRIESKKTDPRYGIYHYLLLSTRLNMKRYRLHAKIDGAELLEELSAHVVKSYLGLNRAKSIVFGTACKGTFTDKVNRLCELLLEGGGFHQWDRGHIYAQDAKLDVVTWIPFSDQQPGKLIVFTQCKTGSTWQGHLGDLIPDAFLKTWTKHRSVMFTPIRAFCVSEAANRSRWTDLTSHAGLFFDRCRLVDFCCNIDKPLLKKISSWTDAAKQSLIKQIKKVKGGAGANKRIVKRKHPLKRK